MFRGVASNKLFGVVLSISEADQTAPTGKSSLE